MYMNAKLVHRIWWQEEIKVPREQPKRGRLWLNNGSCIRLRPESPMPFPRVPGLHEQSQ